MDSVHTYKDSVRTYSRFLGSVYGDGRICLAPRQSVCNTSIHTGLHKVWFKEELTCTRPQVGANIMTEDLLQLWNHVLQRTKRELNNPNLDMLIQDARPVALASGTLTIQFPDQWAKDWVEARHLDDVKTIVLETIPSANQLEFVASQANGHKTQSPVYTPKRKPATNGTRPTRVSDDNRERMIGAPLNPRYTFDSFVVGPSNRFAQAASLAVAEDPAGAYNPLFLYGGVGLGKTHLMQAIAHYVREHHKGMYVVYVSSETFTNDLINSLSRRSMPEFRRKYRHVDLLLIDDIQFVAGKEQTQEEFFHTFNSLYEANKQIVISSDRLPKEIPTLEERLRSRFEWGLTTDIQAPDLETRMAILNKKANLEGVSLPNDTLLYIASEIQSNIRELEGALVRVMAYASLQGSPLTPEVAAEALKDIITARKTRIITIELIQKTVGAHYGIDVTELKGKKRNRSVTFPRQIAMFLCRELTDASLPRIGEQFGGRDHSTVIHAHEKIRMESEKDGILAQTINEISQKIKNG